MNVESVYTKGLPHCKAEHSKDNLKSLGFASHCSRVSYKVSKQTCQAAEYPHKKLKKIILFFYAIILVCNLIINF